MSDHAAAAASSTSSSCGGRWGGALLLLRRRLRLWALARHGGAVARGQAQPTLTKQLKEEREGGEQAARRSQVEL